MEQKQKTVAIVTPYFPPQGGGLERYAREIALRMQYKYKWKVIVISSGDRHGKDRKEEVDGLTVYRLKYGLKFSNTPFSFGWFFKIRNILKSENPDIVNIHTPVPGIGDIAALLTRKKPLIVTYHTSSMRKGRALSDMFIWIYEHGPLKYLLHRADHIVCSSDFVRLEFLRRYCEKSSTIEPATDCEFFKPANEKKNFRPTILFAAALLSQATQHKGLKTLLDATNILKNKYPDLQLVIVGDGEMKEDYQKYARRIGLENIAIFAGSLNSAQMVSAYQQAHIFALPTSSDSYPMVIIEAMACGLPVISTKIGGIPSMIEDGKEGFLIHPHDHKILADKIKKILLDVQMAESFSRAARKRVEKEFSWCSRVQAYDNILKKALEEVGT